jgi:hypothetical protein
MTTAEKLLEEARALPEFELREDEDLPPAAVAAGKVALELNRRFVGVELNPAYVDVAIERWQSFTGQEAVLAETGETFAALKAKRLAA